MIQLFALLHCLCIQHKRTRYRIRRYRVLKYCSVNQAELTSLLHLLEELLELILDKILDTLGERLDLAGELAGAFLKAALGALVDLLDFLLRILECDGVVGGLAGLGSSISALLNDLAVV